MVEEQTQKPKTKRNTLIGCGVLLVIVILIAVGIGTCLGDTSTETPEPSPSAPAAQSPAAPEPSPLQPIVLVEKQGYGGDVFSFTTMSDEWAAGWSFKPGPEGYGNLIQITTDDFQLIANVANVQSSLARSTTCYGSGLHQVTVNSVGGEWSIKIVDLRP